MKQVLMIFARNPVLGQVKQRIACVLGEAAALRIYKRLLGHTLDCIADCIVGCTVPLRCDKWLWYAGGTPTEAAFLPADCTIQHQPTTGHLGERMAFAFAKAFAAGYDEVVIIGSDCDELTTGHLLDAFAQLKTHEAVLGPAADGGYYLLGLREPPPKGLFDHTKWSTDEVHALAMTALAQANRSVALLPTLHDTDYPPPHGSRPHRGFP